MRGSRVRNERWRGGVVAVAVALVAGAVLAVGPLPAAGDGGGGAPVVAEDEFPVLSEEKWLGSVNRFTDPLFGEYFNQVTPENAGKWGSVAGLAPGLPRNWGGLDQAYDFAKANGYPFNFHVLLWGNQQPTWMAGLPPEAQLAEIEAWFAAVAERYPDIEYLQVVNEPTWDPPDCDDPKNAAINDCLTSGDYVDALGGWNGTDGTGWDWVLNAFRLAKEYFPDTKLMINDVNITNSHRATSTYLYIVELLQEEGLVDVIGLQGHAFVTTEVESGPTVWRRPWAAEEDMAVHRANLDRLAATGLPIQITEIELDGADEDGVPGDEVQLADYRRVFPTYWEHPAVEGVTLWGWRAPNHWRNAQGAPIVRDNGELKPAGHWLINYVNGVAPVVVPDQVFTVGEGSAVGTLEATDWASDLGREDLRTFTWSLVDGDGFAVHPATGELTLTGPPPEPGAHTVVMQVHDGHHTSEPVEVTVVVPPE